VWKPDLEAIREAARGDRLMAKTAKTANPATPGDDELAKLATLAKLAISHRPECNPELLALHPDLRRLLGLLDDVGGLDFKGVAAALGEPVAAAIRMLDDAKARGLVRRTGPWWNLTRRAFNLVSEVSP
jgi:hypothetical protein